LARHGQGIDHVEYGLKHYEAKVLQTKQRSLRRLARQLGRQLVPMSATSAVTANTSCLTIYLVHLNSLLFHCASDPHYLHHRTRVVANPRGYVRWEGAIENLSFQKDLVITLATAR